MKYEFEGRETKEGAYSTMSLYSLKNKREIPVQDRMESGTGRHWTDAWFLKDGKYYVLMTDITNSGKHHCGFGVLNIEGNKDTIEWEKEKPPNFISKEDLCYCLKEKLGLVEESE